MKLNVFENYIIDCKKIGIDPTWKGLNKYTVENNLNNIKFKR